MDGNGWEWGVLGLSLLVIMDYSRKFPAKHQYDDDDDDLVML
jgi:hypothetical protein